MASTGRYILFGGIAGGIYFNEFGTLHEGPGGYFRWVLYIGGMMCAPADWIAVDAVRRMRGLLWALHCSHCSSPFAIGLPY